MVTSGMRTSGLALFTVIEDSLEKGRRVCAVWPARRSCQSGRDRSNWSRGSGSLALPEQQVRTPLGDHLVAIRGTSGALRDRHRVALPLHGHLRIAPPGIGRRVDEDMIGLVQPLREYENERP